MKRCFTLRHYIGDAVLCGVLAALLIFGCTVLAGNGNNKKVRILQDGEVVAVLDLSRDCSFDVGGVSIEIRDGKAVICDSDCPDKVCTKMSGVDKNGGGAVCIPNRVVLEPLSDSSGTDAVAG